MPAFLNPQDRRIARTRKHLQRAFMELLAEKAFEGVTIQDIADRADVNRATFYKHFQDKFELMDLMIAGLFANTLSRWVPADATMTEETLTNLLRAVCDWHDEKSQCGPRPIIHATLIEGVTRRHLCEHVHQCLQQTSSLSHNAPQQIMLAATGLSWAIYGMALQWSLQKSQTVDTLVAEALPLLSGSLSALYAP